MYRPAILFAAFLLCSCGCQSKQERVAEPATSFNVTLAEAVYPAVGLETGVKDFWPTTAQLLDGKSIIESFDSPETIAWIIEVKNLMVPDSIKGDSDLETAETICDAFTMVQNDSNPDEYRLEFHHPDVRKHQEFHLLNAIASGCHSRLIEQGSGLLEKCFAAIRDKRNVLSTDLAKQKKSLADSYTKQDEYEKAWTAIRESGERKTVLSQLRCFVKSAQNWRSQTLTRMQYDAIAELAGLTCQDIRSTGPDAQFAFRVTDPDGLDRMIELANGLVQPLEVAITEQEKLVSALVASDDNAVQTMREQTLSGIQDIFDALSQQDLLLREALDGDAGWAVLKLEVDGESYVEAEKRALGN